MSDPYNHTGRLVTAEVERRAVERAELLERNKEANELFARWTQNEAIQRQNMGMQSSFYPTLTGYTGPFQGSSAGRSILLLLFYIGVIVAVIAAFAVLVAVA